MLTLGVILVRNTGMNRFTLSLINDHRGDIGFPAVTQTDIVLWCGFR